MPTLSVITVSQLNSYVKAVLEMDSNLSGVLVSGEISNLKKYNSAGHLYFSLKDDKSVLKSIMFAGDARKLQFELKDGMKVVVHGRISCYEINGQYQLYVDNIRPEGLGAVYLAFEQVKLKLMNEGLFDQNFKKPIPKFPSKVGIITSESGAVIHDIKTVAERRFPICDIILYPVEVQGKNASWKIIEGIKYFNNTEKVDTIIVGRGGGSAEDLWVFNDENLAREIFNSRIPVISAVGHETDYTICDFVADVRAATPSVAAEIAFPDRKNIMEIIDDSLIRMQNIINSEISYVRDEKLNNLRNRLSESFKKSLKEFWREYELLLTRLNASSVEEKLKKGFSIVFSNNKKLKKIDEFEENMKISIAVSDGVIDCEIKNISKNKFLKW